MIGKTIFIQIDNSGAFPCGYYIKVTKMENYMIFGYFMVVESSSGKIRENPAWSTCVGGFRMEKITLLRVVGSLTK